jgi:hypothetical protein
MATASETLRADAQGRIALPAEFAGATVILERVSETELHIRKVPATAEQEPEEEITFYEESPIQLSPRDQERLLELLENPPPPNEALLKAAARYKERHG